MKCVGMIGTAFAGCLGIGTRPCPASCGWTSSGQQHIERATLFVLVSKCDNSEKQHSPQAAVTFVIIE